MRYSLLAPGKRLRPLLVLMAAEACGGDGQRRSAGGLRRRDGAYVLADPRRPAGDGRRRPAPRPADLPQEVRRGAGDPGRRRPADAGFSGAGGGLSAGDRGGLLSASWPGAPGRPAWSAARSKTWPGRADARRAARSTTWRTSTPARPGALFRACLRLGVLVGPGRTARRTGSAAAASGSTATAAASAWRSRSPTICSTSKATPSRPASACGKDAARGKLTYPGLLGVDESRRRAEQLCRQACEHVRPLGDARPAALEADQSIVDVRSMTDTGTAPFRDASEATSSPNVIASSRMDSLEMIRT